jgi:uncharacterized membrane-anchored protein
MMQTRHLPVLGVRYWVAISVASMAGANLGDFVSRILHLGHLSGVPPLLAVFAAILVVERRDRSATELYYWLAVLVLRTIATNLADLATHDLRLGYGWAIGGLCVLVLAALELNRDTRHRDGPAGLPAANGFYWATMLIAGTLGTAIGDWVADVSGLGLIGATLILGAILAALLRRRTRPAHATKRGYWLTVVGVRSAGTTAGDLSAHMLGLVQSTFTTNVALVGLLVLWRDRRVSALGPA